MKRIATPNRAVDKFAVGKDGFRAAVAGVSSATEFSDLWFNHVQEAIVRTIESAGLALSDTDYDQFVTALSKLIKVAGMQHSGPFTVGISRPLTAVEAIGNLVVVYGQTGPITLTLPAASTCPNGGAINFLNAGGFDVTLTRAGADFINPGTANTSSVVLKPGDTLALSLILSAVTWECFGGSAQLAYSSVFSASKAISGYQKLPGGLIIQWADITSAGTNNVAFSFPIAFPTACLQAAIAGLGTVANNMHLVNLNSVPTASGGTMSFFTSTTGAAPVVASAGQVSARYIAIGY
jgi:hypothetical protein